MKKARENISHFRFIFFNLKIFGEIIITFFFFYALYTMFKRSIKHKSAVVVNVMLQRIPVPYRTRPSLPYTFRLWESFPLS